MVVQIHSTVYYAGVAQSVAHLICNQRVVSSSLTISSIFFEYIIEHMFLLIQGCGWLREIKVNGVKLLYNPKNISISDAKAQLRDAQARANGSKFHQFIAVSPHRGEPWYEKLKEFKHSNLKWSNRRKSNVR